MKRAVKHRRRAIVLVIVLVVVAMLALGAYSYTDLMRSYQESSKLAGQQLQAKLMVDSGIDYVRIFLAKDDATHLEAGGLYDNPTTFKQIVVNPSDDPLERGYFTIVAPALDDEGRLAGVRFGLEDESTRLNLNTLLLAEKQQPGSATTFLMALPGMTAEAADSILDWMDEDDDPRESGAETDYYLTLEPPYAPKNGPLDTVEELLRVRGVTPSMLFGADANRNGQIDPNEQVASNTVGPIASDPATTTDSAGADERGWAAYLTLHSSERNLRPDGRPRIFLNANDLTQLHADLTEVFPADWVTYILAYRQNGAYSGTDQAQVGVSRQLDLTKSGKQKLTQLLDLIGTKTRVTFPGDSRATVLDSPFRSDIGSMNGYLPILLDFATVNPAERIPGRININQAPAAILRGIPGMDDGILEQILSLRTPEVTSEKPNRRHETWLLAEAVVQLQQMRLLQPFINSGGRVYRTQLVGYFQSGEAAARSEVIFDATGIMPRLLLWRDMSHLGRGYALETLGVDYSE